MHPTWLLKRKIKKRFSQISWEKPGTKWYFPIKKENKARRGELKSLSLTQGMTEE